ncbi:MAG: hypothetical protein KAI24_04555, partial [Planctomycetes bacterium]|nr:hypothetical protein [Planctomycetota bacterium]
MGGREELAERRALWTAVAVAFGLVVAMMLAAPAGDAHAALQTALPVGDAPPPQGAPEFVSVDPQARPTDGPDDVADGHARVLAPTLPVLHDPRLREWVDDLRDDDERWNATHAMRELSNYARGEIPELEHALGSHDPQLRHFAAGVLRNRVEAGLARASDRLLRVSVAALRSDLDAVERAAMATWVYPLAPRAARFLSERAQAAHEWLEQGLFGADPQQRFLCAYLLAQAGLHRHAGRIAYELVDHLNDNRIRGDAAMAAHGLYRLGGQAVPVLLASRRYLDRQGRELADLIRFDLQSPPRTKKDLYARNGRARVSPL